MFPSTLVLAQNLFLFRWARGLTQQQLARDSDVSRATIAMLEAGQTDPRLSTLEALAGTLGVSTVLLFFSQRELQALLAVQSPVSPSSASAGLPESLLATLRTLQTQSSARRRLQAAELIWEYLRGQGVESEAHRLGAALAAVYHPGPAIYPAARFTEALL